MSLINRAGEAMIVAVAAAELREALTSFLVAAVEQSTQEGRVEIVCREQRGAVVLRATGSQAEGIVACDTAEAARHADAAGGSVIYSRGVDDRFTLELRLPVPNLSREVPQGETCDEKGQRTC